MRSTIRSSALLLAVMSAVTGIFYPLVVTGIARVLFPAKARGSVIEAGGRPVGSHLVGQWFDDPRWFWSRPSATPVFPYNAACSGGSNLDLNDPALTASITARVTALHAADPANRSPIPADLVTASGSGLDPHISPAAAYYQVARVARARALTEDSVRRIVEEHTEKRTLGILGEPRVNVLELNSALDAIASRTRGNP